MKNGKRLTMKHKLFLTSKGLEPKNYLVTKDTSTKVEFLNRSTGKLESFCKA